MSQLMESVFKMSEKKLYHFLYKHLLNNDYTKNDIIVNNSNYIMAQGKIPVLLVAHLDTVHKFPPKEIFHDKEKNVIWSPSGLGADDRAGVYAILKIISKDVNNSKAQVTQGKPWILFTSGEEKGGIGAYAAINTLKKPKVKYMIELDRKGSNDAVFYDCYNKKFVNYITSFGFIKSYGSFSDISILCPAWNIAGVNLSIGYYNAHTKAEYLKINEMNATLNIVKNIIYNAPKNKFKYYTKDLYKKDNIHNSYEFYFEDELLCTDEEIHQMLEYENRKDWFDEKLH